MIRSNMIKYREVSCPTCLVRVGQPCVTSNGNPAQPHQARMRRWREFSNGR